MCTDTDDSGQKREQVRAWLLEAPDEERLWAAIEAFAGCPFSTATGLELQVVTGPKKLGVFGASYIYPVFIEIGVIRRTGKGDR